MPVGVSHVAVVTADLDGFRAFYEDTIGLETTIVFGAGPGHARQAVIVAGDVMLHVFEVPGFDPTRRVSPRRCSSGDGSTTSASPSPTRRHCAALRDRLLAVDASSGVIRRLGPMLSVRFHDPDGCEGEINCLDPAYDPIDVARRGRDRRPGPGSNAFRNVMRTDA